MMHRVWWIDTGVRWIDTGEVNRRLRRGGGGWLPSSPVGGASGAPVVTARKGAVVELSEMLKAVGSVGGFLLIPLSFY